MQRTEANHCVLAERIAVLLSFQVGSIWWGEGVKVLRKGNESTCWATEPRKPGAEHVPLTQAMISNKMHLEKRAVGVCESFPHGCNRSQLALRLKSPFPCGQS